jgi:RNA polymerase sigma factor (sigma-70 family)
MPQSGMESLTAREQEVLQLVAAHLTDLEIAQQLVISESTVHRHVHNILRKLRVHDRHGAARLWIAGRFGGFRNT